MENIDTAIILAGGQSRRMGFDKKYIEVEGKYLLDSIVKNLEKEFERIIIVTNTPYYLIKINISYIKDEIENIGPLGGIHSGLKYSDSEYNYIIACDMPYINLKYIRYLKNQVEDNIKLKPDAVVTRFNEWIEPFNGIYSKKIVKNIEDYINNKKRNIYSLISTMNTLYVEEKIARKFSPDWRMFKNLNTKRDLYEYVNSYEYEAL